MDYSNLVRFTRYLLAPQKKPWAAQRPGLNKDLRSFTLFAGLLSETTGPVLITGIPGGCATHGYILSFHWLYSIVPSEMTRELHNYLISLLDGLTRPSCVPE